MKLKPPYGTTKNQAIQGRGAKGDINFNTVDDFKMLIAPYVERYNSYEDKNEIKPSSPVFAGLRVKVDREDIRVCFKFSFKRLKRIRNGL